MEKKWNEIWEENFNTSEYAFDFANQLIIKSEYKTDSPFAWNTELYDYENDKEFIASLKSIEIRDKKSIFEINGKKYIITKNLDYSYAIIPTDQIINEKLPVNFDIFLNHKINNYEEKNYSFLLISLKKMSSDMLNIFNNYVTDYLKKYNQLISFEIDDSDYSKVVIKFQFLLENNFNVQDIFEIGLSLSSLMPLIIFRLKSLDKNIWDDMDSITENDNYYNIFISSKKTFENCFALRKITTLGMIAAFENSIFIDEKIINKFSESGYNINNFVKARNAGIDGIYEYKFIRNDISQYNKVVFGKSKK